MVSGVRVRTDRKAGGSRGAWRKGLAVLIALGLGWLALTYARLPDAAPLVSENPKTTALIEARAEEAREKRQKVRRRQSWVRLDQVERSAVDAVVLAEDASFYLHGGVDTEELKKAVQDSLEKRQLGRGASTISQQLAKNLWLSTDRSLLRKLKEVVLARRLEEALTKRRILTLYLNVVEWGDGVYGIEAAAREHFGVSARQLTPMQSVVLAAMLPAPRKRLPRTQSPALYRHAARILARMEASRRLDPAAASSARFDLALFFGRAAPAEAESDAGDDEEPSPSGLLSPSEDEAL